MCKDFFLRFFAVFLSIERTECAKAKAIIKEFPMTIRTQIHLCLCCMQEHTTIDIDVSSIYLLTNSKYIPVISGFIVSIPDGKKKGNREGNFISFSVILQDRPDLRFIGNVCLQRNHFPSKVHGFQIWKEFTIKDFITSFCGHLTYIEILWKLWNEEWIDPMEVFCSRHTFFLWPYMTTKKTLMAFKYGNNSRQHVSFLARVHYYHC